MTVAAAVVAAGGGSRLRRALDSVAWADEILLLDPARRLGPADLPAGVRHVTDALSPGATAQSRWLLLITEDESVTAALAAEIRSVVQAPGGSRAFRIPVVVHALGAELRVRSAPLRLAGRARARLRLRPGLVLDLDPGDASIGRLAGVLRSEPATTVGEMVDALDAHGAVAAAVLQSIGARRRLTRYVTDPLVAWGLLMTARASGRLGWGRWILSTIAGYRALVAHAKRWELRRAAARVPS